MAGIDLSRLLSTIEERLFVETPKAVKRAKRRSSPTWSCVLVFDGSAPPFLPPEIALRHSPSAIRA